MRPESYCVAFFAGVGAVVFILHIWRGLVTGCIKTIDFAARSFERQSHPIRYWAWMILYAGMAIILTSFVVACLVT